MVLKGFPYGSNIGSKSTVILYTYINHHLGTPKQKQTSYLTVLYFGTKSSRLRYSDIL